MPSLAPLRGRWTTGYLVVMSVRTSVLGIDFQNRIRNLLSPHPLTCKLWQHKIGRSLLKKHSKKFFPVRPSTEPSLKALSGTLNFCLRIPLRTEAKGLSFLTATNLPWNRGFYFFEFVGYRNSKNNCFFFNPLN